MHKNKFHVCLHIFVDNRELQCCIHCDLKEYIKKAMIIDSGAMNNFYN